MEKVEQSIDLNKIIKLIRENDQLDFWYVDRRARLLKFKIDVIKKQRINFQRLEKLSVDCYHLLKNKELFTNKKQTAGTFFDKYYRKGHFFATKNDAVKYMIKRVHTDRKDVVKSARNFIDEHPEYLI